MNRAAGVATRVLELRPATTTPPLPVMVLPLAMASAPATHYLPVVADNPGNMSPAVDTPDPELANLREHLPNGNVLTMAYDGNRRESPPASLSVTISRSQAGAIQPGTWRLVVTTTQGVRAKEIHAWIERSADRQTGFTQFVRPD